MHEINQRQIVHGITSMWNLKKKSQTHGNIEQISGYQGLADGEKGKVFLSVIR